MKKSNILICPKCNSSDVETDFSNAVAVARGFIEIKKCNNCEHTGTFFPSISKEKLKKLKESREFESDLTKTEKEQIEQDFRDIIGIEDEDSPVVLDFETVKIIKPGKYILDIANLFSKERPLVYKLEDGKYFIDLTSQIKAKKENQKDIKS